MRLRSGLLRPTLSTIALTSIVLILAACPRKAPKGATPADPFPIADKETIATIAQAYVRVVIALGERDPDSLDFATVSASVRDPIHQAYPSLIVIDREAARISARINTQSFTDEQQSRAQFIDDQLKAVRARILILQGHTLDFVTEARILFRTGLLPDREAADRAALRDRIVSLLPHERGAAAPSARYAAYDKNFLIPPERLPAVMTAALEACRQQTLSYIALPAGESVDLTFVRNQPWSAFSRFRGHDHSTIQINVDFPVTVDQALELACHEGYPGHHVFNTLHDRALTQQKHWPEAEVQLTFSPQSYLSESTAAFAPRLAFSATERVRIERDILFPLAGLPAAEAERYETVSSLVRQLDSAEPAIAQMYLDGQLEFVRAAQQLQQQMLMQHPEASLLYLNEFRSYVLGYTDGPRRIATLLHSSNSPLPADRRASWDRFRQLTETPSPTLPDSEPDATNRYPADRAQP